MRSLNDNESDIVRKKAHRSGTVIHSEDLTVGYKLLFPRITLCVIHDSALGVNYCGATMRSKHDKDKQIVGRNIAFVRAIGDIIMRRNEANVLPT